MKSNWKGGRLLELHMHYLYISYIIYMCFISHCHNIHSFHSKGYLLNTCLCIFFLPSPLQFLISFCFLAAILSRRIAISLGTIFYIVDVYISNCFLWQCWFYNIWYENICFANGCGVDNFLKLENSYASGSKGLKWPKKR